MLGKKDPTIITTNPSIMPKGPNKNNEKNIMATPVEIVFMFPLSRDIAENTKTMTPIKIPKKGIRPPINENTKIIRAPIIIPIILYIPILSNKT